MNQSSTAQPPTYSDLAPADPNDFVSFSAFCKGLPNIKPRLAMQKLDALYQDAIFGARETDAECAGERQLEVSPGVTVAVDELRELNFENDWGCRVISPAGANLLIGLYLAGVFDTGGKQPGTPSDSAVVYASSEHALRLAATERRNAHRRYQAALRHPERFAEADFTYQLLNDIFFAIKGQGAGELDIGGVKVTKSLSALSSNSGKTRDFSVRFTWQGADGTMRVLTQESRFKGNRRNDAERNWGLPE